MATASTSPSSSTDTDAVTLEPSDFPTVFDFKTCLRKGLCPVTKDQHSPIESHSLYFEVHGSSDPHAEKLVLVMGLNGSCFGWIKQVEALAPTGKYQILVFDNRAVGNSSAPRGPYSTSAMAEDVIILLDLLGWTETRSINLVGVSLGGMISLELATRIPERLASLVLAVTTPGYGPLWNFPPWKGLTTLLRLFTISDPSEKMENVLEMVFPLKWLASPNPTDEKGRTWRETQKEIYLHRHMMTRKQTFIGALSQMIAGLTHRVSHDRLRFVAENTPKITIITGDNDNLVAPSCSADLAAQIPEAEYIVWKDTGHALHSQRAPEFNSLVEKTILEGRERSGEPGSKVELVQRKAV